MAPGLRVAEASTLRVGDVDSEPMLLRVERGKGGRYRNAMLSPDLLALLRQWWKVGRQQGVMHRDGWLFPGQHPMKPISTRQLHRIVVEAAQAADIAKRVGPHTLRHSFATLRHHRVSDQPVARCQRLFRGVPPHPSNGAARSRLMTEAGRHLKSNPFRRARWGSVSEGIRAVISKRPSRSLFIQRLLRALSPGSPAGGGAYQDVSEGIAQEELKGLSYMFWGRLAALAILAVWALSLPFERSAGYLSAIAAFALLGAPPYLLARRGYGRMSILVAFLMLDAAILIYVLFVPPPFYVEGWTAQLNLRLPNFLYLGIFLVGMSLSYSPWLVMWAGIVAIVAWSAGFLWVASLPDTVLTTSRQSFDSGLSSEAVISRFLDPRSVSLTIFINQVVFLGLVTLILTVTVWRSRQLVRRQVAAESERASLSRYLTAETLVDGIVWRLRLIPCQLVVLAGSPGDTVRTEVQS